MTNKIMNAIYNIGNNIRQNAAIYSAAGLMAVATACGGPTRRSTVEYDGDIGKDYVYAERQNVIHKGKTYSTYTIDVVLEDGSEVLYTDKDNDKVLDRVSVTPADGEKQMYMKGSGAVFEAANRKYKHLRDTIPQLNLAAGRKEDNIKAASDSVKINQYFK